MTTSGITNINAKLIHQHPDNPRKDLGDLTELSESIKKKGIMQNLTVVPGHWDENRAHHEEGYTLIIGHRRFAAGKMAGVTMYPCRIVQDMSYKDQVGTMLEENMQRIDLTVLEQAEGFQMMLNLGDTEEQIAEKTGFSRTTVHRRLEIAKLDRDLVKEKTDENGAYQLNLKDLAQLSRIEDVETRNQILKNAADSRQIQWKVEEEIKNREREKNKKIIVELLEAAGIKKATKEIERKRYTEEVKDKKSIPLDKEPPEELNIHGTNLFWLESWDGICVVEKLPRKPKEETEWDKQQKKNKELEALQKKMDARRQSFIRMIIIGKIELLKGEERQKVIEKMIRTLTEVGGWINERRFNEVYTGKEWYGMPEEERNEIRERIRQEDVQILLLTVLNGTMDSTRSLVNYDGGFDAKRGRECQKCFKILMRYGWSYEREEADLVWLLMHVICNIFIPSRNQTAANREYMRLIRIRSASTLDSWIRMERRSGRMISLCAMIIRLIL